METSEIIGMAFFAIAILAATWQVAFAFGYNAGRSRGYSEGQTDERHMADRRVQGVLAAENAREPRKRKRLTYRKVDARSVGKKRYLNTRLPGEVLA